MRTLLAFVAIASAAQDVLPETGQTDLKLESDLSRAMTVFAAAVSGGRTVVFQAPPRMVGGSGTVTELLAVSPDGSSQKLFTGAIQPSSLAARDGQVFVSSWSGKETSCQLIAAETGVGLEIPCTGPIGRAAVAGGRVAILSPGKDTAALHIYKTPVEGKPVLESSMDLDPNSRGLILSFSNPERLLAIDPVEMLVTPYQFAAGKWTASTAIALQGPEANKTREWSKTFTPPLTATQYGANGAIVKQTAVRMNLIQGHVTARDGGDLFVLTGMPGEDGPRIVAFDRSGRQTASYRPAGDRKVLRPTLLSAIGDSLVILDRNGVRHEFQRP